MCIIAGLPGSRSLVDLRSCLAGPLQSVDASVDKLSSSSFEYLSA